MSNELTRRRLLQIGAVGSVVGAAGWSTRYGERMDTELQTQRSQFSVPDASLTSQTDPVDVRGAIYIPPRAFNFYQMWRYYDPSVIERDLTYATQVNLNAIRTWLCYEQWERDPDGHERAFDHFLDTAEERDLSVLIGIFDGIGANPTTDRLLDTDPKTSVGLSSPSREILSDPTRWDEPRAFVEWFMENYRDDDRLLGIEVMNEPGWSANKLAFSESMFETLVDNRGSVPLTVGSTSLVNNAEYARWGSEIFQFHYNFVSDQATFQEMLERVAISRAALDTPIWITEWQRARKGQGFTAEPEPDERGPDYASLAPLIHDAGLGNFFWSLMVKPAWVQPQRKNGVINGLFHEDGSVWSLDDALAIQAMSGETSLDVQERQEVPDWMAV
ncbi:glycoside hydrolase [Haloferax namakaokahaiae]|uniref:Glycoside hydrolase n=1 Tax=Haloferax namakaokahaiae TaxID=1748331 RepID=A0ABD5ZK24_9EURY